MDLLAPVHKALAYSYCWAVEAYARSSESWDFRVVKVVQQKGSLDLAERHTDLNGISELLDILPANEPTALIITGKGIVSKYLEGTELSDAHCVSSLLPNAKPSEFLLQRYTTPTGVIASMIRKKQAFELLDLLRSKRIQITDTVVGGTALATLRSLIDSDASELIIGPHHLSFDGEALVDYKALRESSDDQFRIGEEYLGAELLPALAIGLGYFAPDFSMEKVEEEAAAAANEELLYKQIFRFSGWTVLLILLGSLLGNFFLKGHYDTELQELNMALLSSENRVEEVAWMREEVRNKHELIDVYEIKHRAQTAFFADRLAHSLPQSILLSEMTVHPERPKRKREDKTTFRQQVILIGGFAPESTVLNKWIQEMMQENWVQDITIKNYSRDPKKRQGAFELELLLTPDPTT